MKNNQENFAYSDIIEALSIHADDSAVGVLERLGTNCPDGEVRELTSKALVRRNTHESLRVLIINKGKGINDLSPQVAMSTINEILSLSDKSEVMKILEDTINLHSEEDVRETARSVKALIELS